MGGKHWGSWWLHHYAGAVKGSLVGRHQRLRGSRRGLNAGRFGRRCFSIAEENVAVFVEEHGEDLGGNVEGRGENNSDVADGHLIDGCIVDDT